ncbi:hypothetical protein HZS61_007894 [Fusarium oxysporum f. sp. conglutinans]|uniref:BZIP domain-containing protein n=1 Tax=Fusarium oxysporum f. sp. conglutinans TaxID=100902 RepID=A0A8H6GZH2_FUSOX|nr:hypothetical protein HZS61_007894 [Fusarium oxysporum f. sp. conglutinans]
MVRPLSAEPVKSRRKGTRNVSTLTPVQLARKRAKDREAQRAIRARTKEHIERLERELAGLRSKQSRDRTVQELLRRNKAIEKELIQLKEIMRESMTSSSYSAPGLTPQQLSLPDELLTSTVYDGNPRTDSYAIPSPRGSPFPGDYTSLPDYSQQYIPLSHNCESLASTVPCLQTCVFGYDISISTVLSGYIDIDIYRYRYNSLPLKLISRLIST